MNAAWDTLCSIWSWFVLGASHGGLAAAHGLASGSSRKRSDPGRYWVGYMFRQLGVLMATLNPLWQFRISGTMPKDPRRPYLVVSNHESFVDILLISHLPWEMKWLSKAELFRIPVLGWLMRLAGDIPVDRGNARAAAEAMVRCKEILKEEKVSVIIFPEGTRSDDGRDAAVQGRRLPSRHRCRRAHPAARRERRRHGAPRSMTGGSVARWRRCRVLEPVETEGLTRADIAALRDRVWQMIARGARPDAASSATRRLALLTV